MIDSPIVSVLMTAYNREQFIAEAIESVLASTFADFELIIVDDASTDETVDVAKQYNTDCRVQIHINKQNLGDYPNRNYAALLAKGKYLKYLDSDDVIYPYGLEKMVEVMERFPDVALGIGRPASSDGPYPIRLKPKQAYFEHFLGQGLLHAGPSGCIMRTDAFRALNGFSGIRYVGDTEMWLRLAARYPVVKMPGDLVWWRQHEGQEYRNNMQAYAFLDFQIAMTALRNQRCPLSGNERGRAVQRVKYNQSRLIWRLALRERRFIFAFRLYRDSNMLFKELMQGLRPRSRQNI